MTSSTGAKLSERGSAHVWIIIILIVAIIGLLGFILWQQLAKSAATGDISSDETSKVEESDADVDDQDESSNDTTYATYSSDDAGTYVKSFKYPASWHVVDDVNEICRTFDFCASPPLFLLVDEDNTVKLLFSPVPQEVSDTDTDTVVAGAASEIAVDNGVIASGFTSLDGVTARKIEFAEAKKVSVVFESRGGFGYMTFFEPAGSENVETVLSSWRWA